MNSMINSLQLSPWTCCWLIGSADVTLVQSTAVEWPSFSSFSSWKCHKACWPLSCSWCGDYLKDYLVLFTYTLQRFVYYLFYSFSMYNFKQINSLGHLSFPDTIAIPVSEVLLLLNSHQLMWCTLIDLNLFCTCSWRVFRGIWRGWHFLPRTSMNVLSEGEDAFSECHFLIYVKVLKKLPVCWK